MLWLYIQYIAVMAFIHTFWPLLALCRSDLGRPRGFKESLARFNLAFVSAMGCSVSVEGKAWEAPFEALEVQEAEISGDEDVKRMTRSVRFENPLGATGSKVLSRQSRVVSSRSLELVDEAEESDEDIDALLEEIGDFKASRVSRRRAAPAS